jgi:predicted nuclease of predicted toxin-antitoxin system
VKLKLDENLPVTAAPRLAALGFDTDTVFDEGLSGRDDAEVWAAAQNEGRFFVTQDMDFSDSRKFRPGSHHGLLVVRIPDSEQWRVADYLYGWFSSPDAKSWEGAFVVATATKIRVLKFTE